jgi:dTDP-4-amino-4,6-dideoxygalactose transaminase
MKSEMTIVSYPDYFAERLLDQYKHMMRDGQLAEGTFYNKMADAYVKGKKSIPVSSGGAALFTLLAFHKYINNKTHVIIQSNTMRALYTIPKLLNMEVVICDSSARPGFMAMDANALAEVIKKLEILGLLDKSIAVYSIIGGYLSPSFVDIEAITRQRNVPLIVDAAHGHCLDRLMRSESADLAFSFYATKVLPAGEGGLVTTSDERAFKWINRFLTYDRFNYEFQVGINLRASEMTAYFIYLLMTDAELKRHFVQKRIAIANCYKRVCRAKGFAFLDHDEALEYNGYKVIVFEAYEKVEKMTTVLTAYKRTSPVFAVNVIDGSPLLPHWCPPTYPSLYDVLCKHQ